MISKWNRQTNSIVYRQLQLSIKMFRWINNACKWQFIWAVQFEIHLEKQGKASSKSTRKHDKIREFNKANLKLFKCSEVTVYKNNWKFSKKFSNFLDNFVNLIALAATYPESWMAKIQPNSGSLYYWNFSSSCIRARPLRWCD